MFLEVSLKRISLKFGTTTRCILNYYTINSGTENLSAT